MVRPMLQRKVPSPGGEIHGFVVAGLWEGLELREAALSGAQVFVETTTGSVEEQSVTRTNSEARVAHIDTWSGGNASNSRMCSGKSQTSCTKAQLQRHAALAMDSAKTDAVRLSG